MVPEQAIHKGILRLHHRLTATEHSSGAEERYEGEHCELCAGTICSRIWRDLESDMNWRTELSSTNQLATDGLTLMTDF